MDRQPAADADASETASAFDADNQATLERLITIPDAGLDELLLKHDGLLRPWSAEAISGNSRGCAASLIAVTPPS